MLYAAEVISLMAAFPGRQFKAQQICRYVCPKPKDQKERSRVRIGVHRVLRELRAAGSVAVGRASMSGGYNTYAWR